MNNLSSIKSDGSEIYRDESRSVTTTDNVVSINRNKVPGTYLNARERKIIPEEAYFVGGVIFSLVLPQFIYSLYGGFLVTSAFAGSGLAGLILGFVMYNHSPYRPSSIFSLGAVPGAPKTEGKSLGKAA